MKIGDLQAQISISAGIVSLGSEAEPVDALRRADVAMYSVKQSGRNGFAWFDRQMEQQIQARVGLEDEIRARHRSRRIRPLLPAADQPRHRRAERVRGAGAMEFAAARTDRARRLHRHCRAVRPDRRAVHARDGKGLRRRPGIGRPISSWRSTSRRSSSAIRRLAERIVQILTETGFPAAPAGSGDHRRLAARRPGPGADHFAEPEEPRDRHRARRLRHRLRLAEPAPCAAVRPHQDRPQLHQLARPRANRPRRSSRRSRRLAKPSAFRLPPEGVESESIRQQMAALGCTDAQGWHFGRAVSGQVASMQIEAPKPAPKPSPVAKTKTHPACRAAQPSRGRFGQGTGGRSPARNGDDGLIARLSN